MGVNDLNIADVAAQADEDQQHRYHRAWKAYDGEGPLPFGDESGQADDNVRLDYPRLIVDKGVSFLAGKGGVSFQLNPAPKPDTTVDEDAETAEEAAADELNEPSLPATDPSNNDPIVVEPAPVKVEAPWDLSDKVPDGEDGVSALEQARTEAMAALDAAWPEEDRHADFHRLATNGGVCGHAWARLYEDACVSVLDPSNCTAVWDEDDMAIIKRYLITWLTVDEDTGNGKNRRKRFEPDVPAKPTSWTIHTEEFDEDTQEWEAMVDPVSWPYSFPPMLGAQNLPAPNTYYGEPDLTPAVLDLHQQLESVASDMRRIVRLQGHPIPVVIGEEAHRLQELSVAIGELLAIPNKDAKLEQLTIADLVASMSLYEALKTSLFETTHIPKVALGETTNAGPTTGVALRVEYEPLLEQTETKRLTYGPLLRQLAEQILTLRGYPGWRVTLAWPELLPPDDLGEAQAAEADLSMGIVSRQTISERRGYDWEVEQERLAAEKTADAETLAAAFDKAPADGVAT